MSEFNDWFCSLPEGRQAVLRDDKWRLADNAFQAGFEQVQAEIDALKAQNAELLAAQQWRDIESAPKDGTDFLVDYEGVTIARWQPDGSPFPWIFLDTDDGKFIFNRFRESVEGLVWRPKPLGWEAIAKVRGVQS